MFSKSPSQIVPGLRLNGIPKARSLDAQSTTVRGLPEWEPAIPASRLFFMVVMLLTSFSAVSLGVMTLAQQASVPVDPFAAYIDILPEEPKSAVESRGFSCYTHAYKFDPSKRYETCVLRDTATQAFSGILVSVTNGIITQSSFIIRNHMHSLGDLMLLLGVPYHRVGFSTIAFSWRGRIVLAWASPGQVVPLRPVWKVIFTNIRAPD
jgi:hypothetical protein